MSRRRILIVSEPMEYGVLSYLERLFEGIDRTRWEPALAFSPGRMAPQARTLVDGLRADGVRVRALPFRRGAGLDDARAALGLAAEVREFRPHVIHLHSTKAGLVGRVVARCAGIPALYTPHGTSWHYTGRVLGRVQLRLERLLRPATHALVAVCAEEARAFIDEVGFAPGRVHVVRNGVRSPDAAVLRASRQRKRAALGIAPDEPWLLFVGRLTREKGFDVLLAALRENVDAAGLLVVGDGAERSRLEAAAARTALPVRFCGYREDVAPFFAAADVFVQPSRSEGLPFTVLEAMAHGLPVVGTHVGGMADALVGCGRVVAPDEPQLLAAAIRELASDTRLRRALGAAARERSTREYGMSAMLAALHDAYDEAYRHAGAARRGADPSSWAEQRSARWHAVARRAERLSAPTVPARERRAER